MVTAARTQDAVTVTPTLNNSAAEWDSDLEAEPDPVDWSRGVDEEVLKQLSAREKKRQEVINGTSNRTRVVMIHGTGFGSIYSLQVVLTALKEYYINHCSQF